MVVVVNDNSQSVKNSFGSDSAVYQKKLKNLIEKLSSKYEVAQYNAGDALKRGIDFSFTDKSTDLSHAIEEINGLYYNQNLGAVILASDGIYNKGINPVYSAAQAPYAIYTIALGDTTVQKDQKIAAVFFNKIVYLNDLLTLRTDIEANNLAGKNVKLNIYELTGNQQSKLLQSKDVSCTGNNFFESFDFVVPANRTGLVHYRIVLSNTEGEITYRNNVRDVFVEVLDGRQKILLVANSPHPDIAALKAAIESNKNYQLDVAYAESFSKSLREYNLIILHLLPSKINRVENILKEVKSQEKPILFVVGSQTHLPAFQQAQNALQIKGNANKFNEVTATFNNQFSLFTLSENTIQAIPKLPPFSCFFAEFSPNPTAKILLQQKINSVATDFPLWLVNETGNEKAGVIAGEGLWHWRLYDFMINKNHDATNELINKTIQYLSVKTDKRPFRVNIAKNIFQDNEAVIFDAQLYNANYELVNNTEVTMKVTGEDGKETTYEFNKTENAYRLNVGFLPVGNYRYTASAKFGNGTYNSNGQFSVSPLQLEDLRTQADHRVLYQLATQHKGAMHAVSNMEKIADEIDSANELKPVLYDTITTESAINLKWIFFLLLGLISAEWITRKYLGGY